MTPSRSEKPEGCSGGPSEFEIRMGWDWVLGAGVGLGSAHPPSFGLGWIRFGFGWIRFGIGWIRDWDFVP